MRRPHAALIVLALFAFPAPTAWADGTEVVDLFTQRFLDGKHTENLEGMTEAMQAASGAEPSETLRMGLVEEYGAVVSVAPARLADEVQGYRRYRVAIEFEKTTLDFLIALDGDERIAGFFLVPHIEADDTAEEPPPHRELDITVGDADSGLPGSLTLPEGEGPFAAVVLVHGSGPQDRDETIGPNKPLRDIAWGLAERGIATLRYDKRSFARKADLAAVGDEVTIVEEVVTDARLAILTAMERDEIDGSMVFVAGHSLGGFALPLIGTMEPRPAGLIVLAGMTLPLPEKIVEQFRYIAGVDSEVTAEEQAQIDAIEAQILLLRAALDEKGPDPEGTILGAPVGYYRHLERQNPPDRAAALELPILVMQGTRDYQVTMADFALWQESLDGKSFACLVAYEGLDHLFRRGEGPSQPADYAEPSTFDATVLDDLAGWIESRRCPLGNRP